MGILWTHCENITIYHSHLVNFSTRYLESNRLIWLCCKENVLPFPVWRFYSLLIGRHETMSWLDSISNLWIVYLKKKRLLMRLWVSLFSNTISWTPDLDKSSMFNSRFIQSRLRESKYRIQIISPIHNITKNIFIQLYLSRWILSLFGSTTSQIRLMFFSLSMGQVWAFIVMKRETELAFICSQVILHKVWIFVQIYCFHCQLPKTLTAIPVGVGPWCDPTSACLSTRTMLEIHVCL